MTSLKRDGFLQLVSTWKWTQEGCTFKIHIWQRIQFTVPYQMWALDQDKQEIQVCGGVSVAVVPGCTPWQRAEVLPDESPHHLRQPSAAVRINFELLIKISRAAALSNTWARESCTTQRIHFCFICRSFLVSVHLLWIFSTLSLTHLSLIHIWRCRRSTLCRSRWSPYH